MSVNGAHIPKISLQRPSVDFIDNQLPQIHPAFSHPGVKYDTFSKKFVPVSVEEVMSTLPRQLIPHRTTLPEVNAMKFWSHIFPDSIEKLNRDVEEPKERGYSEHNIRVEKDWDGVRLKLLKAKERYGESTDGISTKPKKTKFQRFFEGAYRKVADNSEKLKVITQIGDQIDYLSPVLAVVDILLDAAATASKVRKQATEAFDPAKIEENFGDIEFFLATFPKDEVIKETSVELVAFIFKGIENAIGFFLSLWLKRTISAIIQGADYQQGLLQSIENIQKCSEKLMKEARKSDMYNTRTENQITIKYIESILKIVLSNSSKLDEAAKERSQMLNFVKKLLDEADEKVKRLEEREQRMEERERKREKRERKREKREKKTLEVLGNLQDELRKANTPSPFLHQAASTTPFPQQLPSPGLDRPSVQMPTPWYPPTGQTLQPPWVVLPKIWPSIPWAQSFIPPQQHFAQPPVLNSADILTTLNTLESKKKDFQYILEQQYQMDIKTRRFAQAALSSREFRKWLTKSSSAELLVQGYEGVDEAEICGVSLLSATLLQSLLSRERYVRLAFFCRLHTEADDGDVGGEAIVKSFIAQILRQHAFDLSSLNDHGVTLEQIRKGKVKDLCKFLVWLIHQLPGDMKVICIIDEIGKYENDELEAKMLMVLKTILRLVHEPQRIIKVMVTSSEATDKVHDMFQDDDDCQLDLDAFDECQEVKEFGFESKLVGNSDESDSSSSSEPD